MVLLDQVEHKYDFVCMIEDDVILKSGFPFFAQRLTLLFRQQQNLNMVRLGRWGEGYVVSLRGAKDILRRINSLGIIANIDNQLRLFSGPELAVWRHTPWALQVPTNKGDIHKTSCLSPDRLAAEPVISKHES